MEHYRIREIKNQPKTKRTNQRPAGDKELPPVAQGIPEVFPGCFKKEG